MSRVSRFLVILFLGGLLGAGAFGVSGLGQSPTTTTAPLVVEATTTSSTTTSSTTTTSTSTTTTTTTVPKGSVLIHGTGDVALDPVYIPALASNGYDHAWSGLNGLFLADDITVINLECVPSDLGAALDKTFTFRCPTEGLPSMAANGIEVANMGNNHSGDFGKEALVDGRQQLIEAGVAPVGAGKDAYEAGEPALFEVNGWKIAVIGFGGVAPSGSWYATTSSPGMRSGDDTPSMVRAVEAASAVADIVVVTIHWGYELDTTPRIEDIERAEAMIAAGADVIFGHHQHRLNPLEYIDGKPVFWGLGNFVWPHNSVPSATTAVARVVVNPDGTLDACMIDAFIATHGRPEITGEAECGPPV
ncbi:MAG: CapA family protein [Actinobacteria bacterium]|nr:MAG: CapA family protein [Actinomycetota bacterium]